MLRHADAQTPQIISGTAYQHNGNHILSQTDARGKTVTHDIDENTDLTRAVTDPNGQQVQYAYASRRYPLPPAASSTKTPTLTKTTALRPYPTIRTTARRIT